MFFERSRTLQKREEQFSSGLWFINCSQNNKRNWIDRFFYATVYFLLLPLRKEDTSKLGAQLGE